MGHQYHLTSRFRRKGIVLLPEIHNRYTRQSDHNRVIHSKNSLNFFFSICSARRRAEGTSSFRRSSTSFILLKKWRMTADLHETGMQSAKFVTSIYAETPPIGKNRKMFTSRMVISSLKTLNDGCRRFFSFLWMDSHNRMSSPIFSLWRYKDLSAVCLSFTVFPFYFYRFLSCG